MSMRINIPQEAVDDFCRRRGVQELAVFGSALTDAFRADSDVDVLVELREEGAWNLFDHIEAEQELAEIFGREVDLVMKGAIRNPFRRQHILSHREIIYAA